MRKTKERARRRSRMIEIIQKSEFPYTPSVMSWICAELEKPAKQVTKEDVATLVSAK
jgi:hypothetical protein